MKNLAVVISICLLSLSSIGQDESPVPPGMTRLGPNSFADEKEVSMADWMAFIYHSLRFEKDTGEALSNLPDTTCLPHKYMPLVRVFLRPLNGFVSEESMTFRSQRTGFQTRLMLHPERKRDERRQLNVLLELPVVCISHEQAMAFCEWRGHVLQNFARFRDESVKIKFRLPTLIEWEEMARTIEDPMDTTSNRGCNAFHFAVTDTCNQMDRMCNKYGPGTCGVSSYQSVGSGFWNLQGNVAEMTLTKGLAKGGSCIQPARLCMPDVDIRYKKPENWLGFRCVAFAIKERQE